MLPILVRIGDLGIATHDVFVVLGATVAVTVFWMENRARNLADRRVWTIAAGSLLTGAIFAKLSTGWRYLAEDSDPTLAGLWLHGGKSVLGGLAGAYLGAVVTKRIIRYPHRTGDLFAPAVALGIAVGRVGCFLTEPIGIPTTLPWGVSVSPEMAAQIPNCPQCVPGASLHPSFLYEIAALIGLYALLRWLRPRVTVPGELFKIFLVGYGTFRFFVEFVRGHDVFVLGLSGSQIFLMFTVPILYLYFGRQFARDAYGPIAPRSGPVAAGRRE